MEELHAELTALVQRAKQARNNFPSLTAPDTLPAVNMAEEICRLGGDFIKLSVRFKQAARAEAEKAVKERRQWSAPKLNAERLAGSLVKRGCHRIGL